MLGINQRGEWGVRYRGLSPCRILCTGHRDRKDGREGGKGKAYLTRTSLVAGIGR